MSKMNVETCYAVSLDSIIQINNHYDAEYLEKLAEKEAPNFPSMP
jgi:hypothetical protein